jgi:hypothetical protein
MTQEDEYRYPPGDIDLTPLGVQLPAPSKRQVSTTKVYAATLDDAAIATAP